MCPGYNPGTRIRVFTGLINRASAACLTVRLEIGGPGRDRTGDLFHAMEARSQLRHRPTIGNARQIGIEGTTDFIFAHIRRIVNANTLQTTKGTKDHEENLEAFKLRVTSSPWWLKLFEILLFLSTGLFCHN
jgi:hypothetical protein